MAEDQLFGDLQDVNLDNFENDLEKAVEMFTDTNFIIPCEDEFNDNGGIRAPSPVNTDVKEEENEVPTSETNSTFPAESQLPLLQPQTPISELGTEHIIRMPTETSLNVLGLAYGCSKKVPEEKGPPPPGQLLHSHFEEIVVNGSEAIDRIVAAAPSFTSTDETLQYRDVYFDYLDHPNTNQKTSTYTDEDITITPSEQEFMERLYAIADITHIEGRRRALLQEKRRALASGNNQKVKNNSNSKNTVPKKSTTTTKTTKTKTKRSPVKKTQLLKPKTEPSEEVSETVQTSPNYEIAKSKSPRKGKRGSLKLTLKKSSASASEGNNNNDSKVKEEFEDGDESELLQFEQSLNFTENSPSGLNSSLSSAIRRKKARDRKRAQTERIIREETAEEREARLQKQRERQRRFYAKETSEQRARRLEKVRQYQINRKLSLAGIVKQEMTNDTETVSVENGGDDGHKHTNGDSKDDINNNNGFKSAGSYSGNEDDVKKDVVCKTKPVNKGKNKSPKKGSVDAHNLRKKVMKLMKSDDVHSAKEMTVS